MAEVTLDTANPQTKSPGTVAHELCIEIQTASTRVAHLLDGIDDAVDLAHTDDVERRRVALDRILHFADLGRAAAEKACAMGGEIERLRLGRCGSQ